MNKAIFLDKDGTLIVDVPYNAAPDKIVLEQGVPAALRKLSAAGYLLVVVSNQAGIAHGYFPEDAITGVRDRLYDLLAAEGVQLNGFFYCPHHPEGKIKNYRRTCDCRKPLPGMILRAAKQLKINLRQSWMIGDILHDIAAGNNAGCQTILLDNGHETEWDLREQRLPGHIASGMEAAADHILASNLQTHVQQPLSHHR